MSASHSVFSLYLHSPFCVHKCGYCDFNSWAETSVEPQLAWEKGVKNSSSFWKQTLEQQGTQSLPVPNSFFWGGGTPSLIENDITARVLEVLFTDWSVPHHAEKTIEVNPETLNLEKLKNWENLGINRLSMGIQSFSEPNLVRLERSARPFDNLRALELVKKYWKSGNWSLDLIFGLPEQSIKDWESDLNQAMVYEPPHISAYQLTLATERSKNWKLPTDIEQEALFDFTAEYLQAKGYHRYEVSNFAKPGYESYHNKNYWNLGSFLGIGPGAAGVLGGELRFNGIREMQSPNGYHQKNPDNFEKWLALAGTLKGEIGNLTARSAKDDLFEKLMMGLRLEKGIPTWLIPLDRAAFEALEKQPWAKGYFDFTDSERLKLNREGVKILETLLPKVFQFLTHERF
jgi:oxygen-independent coproporphyrinogen-3 oxidase